MKLEEFKQNYPCAYPLFPILQDIKDHVPPERHKDFENAIDQIAEFLSNVENCKTASAILSLGFIFGIPLFLGIPYLEPIFNR
ncbi:hypothetical protein [Acidianus bottle-shaped virus 3 strain ABV3]|uniref:Uncharacterized protein n=1 Tax=Acidianus bottle-shaped virus 3 strain ABV3 TaxID=1732174 RepID=A0A0N9NI87_9VIRU|nr:hypothetical protein AVU00_gp39 [Acidianus bottle-shaped virus 3 strain ABV3]ALG96841.1 hypothetical protein [Acidianus bottle-shaped virus 3 strain ABV3]